jgi:hypothetical protein
VKLALTTLGLERFQSLPVPLDEDWVGRGRSREHGGGWVVRWGRMGVWAGRGAEGLGGGPVLHEGEVMKFDQP